MNEAELLKINEQIGAAEEAGDARFLRGVLADELVFRKGDGGVVNKAQFLADVPNRKFERVSKNIKIAFDDGENLALVTLTVEALGNEFRNLRVFERRAAGWQCIIWFNTKLN